MAVISPWVIRNYLLFGSFSPRSGWGIEGVKGSGIWIYLRHGNNPYIGVDWEKEGWFMTTWFFEELKNIPFEKRNDYVKNKVLELIFSNPLRTIKVHLIKFGRFWRLYPHKTKCLEEIMQKSNITN